MPPLAFANLADLAAYFERCGFEAARRADHVTGKAKIQLQAEARTWHRAAEVARQTVDPSPVGRHD